MPACPINVKVDGMGWVRSDGDQLDSCLLQFNFNQRLGGLADRPQHGDTTHRWGWRTHPLTRGVAMVPIQRAADILSTEMEKQNPRGSFNPTLISLISNNNSIQSRPSCFILFNLGAYAELFMASWVGHPSFYVSIAGKTRN